MVNVYEKRLKDLTNEEARYNQLKELVDCGVTDELVVSECNSLKYTHDDRVAEIKEILFTLNNDDLCYTVL